MGAEREKRIFMFNVDSYGLEVCLYIHIHTVRCRHLICIFLGAMMRRPGCSAVIELLD